MIHVNQPRNLAVWWSEASRSWYDICSPWAKFKNWVNGRHIFWTKTRKISVSTFVRLCWLSSSFKSSTTSTVFISENVVNYKLRPSNITITAQNYYIFIRLRKINYPMKIMPSHFQVKELHSQGYSLQTKDPSGQTMLHYAARYGHKDIVKYLISYAPSILNVKDSNL